MVCEQCWFMYTWLPLPITDIGLDLDCPFTAHITGLHSYFQSSFSFSVYGLCITETHLLCRCWCFSYVGNLFLLNCKINEYTCICECFKERRDEINVGNNYLNTRILIGSNCTFKFLGQINTLVFKIMMARSQNEDLGSSKYSYQLKLWSLKRLNEDRMYYGCS